MKKTNQKGVTLIALVITIIVLLILAGIAVGMLRTDNSVLKQSRNAKNETIHSQVVEKLNLEAMDYAIEKNTDKTNLSLIDYLIGKGILKTIDGETNKWQIDVSVLIGAGQTMGTGTATSTDKNDVYVLEETTTSGMLNNMKFASTNIFNIAVKVSKPKTYAVVYYGTSTSGGGVASEGQRLEIGNVEDTEEIDRGLLSNGNFLTESGEEYTSDQYYMFRDVYGDYGTSGKNIYEIRKIENGIEYGYYYTEDGTFIKKEVWLDEK